jgi:hypothetical protein
MRRLRTALTVVALAAPLALVGVLVASAPTGTNQPPLDTLVDGGRWAIGAAGTPVHTPSAVQAGQAQIVQAVTGVIVQDLAYTVINFTLVNLTQG